MVMASIVAIIVYPLVFRSNVAALCYVMLMLLPVVASQCVVTNLGTRSSYNIYYVIDGVS
jgi:hypothetical protein